MPSSNIHNNNNTNEMTMFTRATIKASYHITVLH